MENSVFSELFLTGFLLKSFVKFDVELILGELTRKGLLCLRGRNYGRNGRNSFLYCQLVLTPAFKFLDRRDDKTELT